MASLVLYGSNVADSTLTTACDLASSSGGAEVAVTSSWGSGNTGELRSQGGTFLGYTSIPAPTGNGWLFNPGAGTFAADNWSATFAHSTTVPDPGATDFTIRFFNYEDGTYTLLGSISITGNTATTGRKVFTFPATAMASLFIDTPDFLYVDLWEHDAGGLTADGTLYLSSSSTAGVVNDLQITTPDFAPGGGSGRLDPTIFGSAVADTTLTTTCVVAPTTGGVEIGKNTVYTGGTGNFGEVYSQGNAAANAVTAIPAAPTGHGWVYRPGASTFLAGNWSAVITAATQDNLGTWAFRVFSNIGGVYTLVGTLTAPITGVTKTTYTFAAVSFPAVILGASDFFYFDLWYQDTGGPGAQTVTIYESTTATFGVASDMQITTSLLVPTIATPFVKPYVHFSIPRALGGTIIPLVINPPVIYEPRALGSTLLTDARIFIPRALGGTYVQDDPTLLWVPHALGGTTQVPTSVALTSTIHAIGLESTTLSLATALADTIPGVALLTPTLTASVALSSTLAAIGVLTPSAFTESTALTDTIPAVGTLSGTLLASLGLSTTIPAVGTLSGTFTESTALTVTLPGIGTLTGSLTTSTNVNLAVTIPAVGTVTMAGAALSTTLATTIPAVGVLNPALTASMSLASLSIPAVGTLVGTLVASAPLSSTVAGVGTLSATMAESTSLTSSLSAVGTLAGTLTVGNSVSFTVAIPAVGTLTASAPGLKTALTLSIAALGTIGPGAAFSEALSGTTLAAIGTISGTVSLAVILGVTLPGAGVISGAYQVRTALSLQLMALGALVGTIRVPATFFGPYSATERVSSKLASTHTVTSKSSQHVSSTYTATRK